MGTARRRERWNVARRKVTRVKRWRWRRNRRKMMRWKKKSKRPLRTGN